MTAVLSGYAVVVVVLGAYSLWVVRRGRRSWR
jgi:hypothetical protein